MTDKIRKNEFFLKVQEKRKQPRRKEILKEWLINNKKSRKKVEIII